MSLIPTSVGALGGVFKPAQDQSVIFDGSSDLTRTPVVAGNRKKWTWLGWVYFTAQATTQYLVSAGTGGTRDGLYISTSGSIRWDRGGVGGLGVTRLLRDTGYYLIGLTLDTDNATSADRQFITINGELAATDSGTQPSLGQEFSVNNTVIQAIGKDSGGASRLKGAVSECWMLDGTALSPTQIKDTFLQDFQVGNGTMVAPKAPTGLVYGTTSYNLKFENTGNFGNDSAGSNDWTPNGFVAGDQITSVPGDPFAIISPIETGSGVISEGGLTVAATADRRGSLWVDSGAYSWECTLTGTGSVGIEDGSGTENTVAGVNTDVIEIRIDMDAGTADSNKNSAGFVSLATGLTGLQTALFKAALSVDFGQKGYTPPVGYKTLRGSNLPTPKFHGGDVFAANLRTGTGSSFSVTGAGFQPDFTWPKSRSAVASHILTDVVRGVGLNLSSDSTAAEVTDAQAITSFDIDGFSGGTSLTTNTSGRTYVDWMWKAGGASVSNTDGTITSTVSVAPEGHFSISKATTGSAGDTYGTGIDHDLVILKDTGSVTQWPVWADPMSPKSGSTQRHMFLDASTGQSSLVNTHFRGMGGSLVTVGSDATVLGPIVSYNFKSIPGLCKVGSYLGNALVDGPFVYCGFKPRWVLVKRIEFADNWIIWDAVRNTFNVTDAYLEPDTTQQELSAGTQIDVTSDGFKLRANASTINSANTHLFVAIAEEAGGGSFPWPLSK